MNVATHLFRQLPVLFLALAVARPAVAIGDFSFALWGTLSPPSKWTVASGDFSGDARTDVFGYDSATGTLVVAESSGSAFTQSATPWSTVTPAAGWEFATGDFDGDDMTDVVGYHPSNGSVWIGINTGSTFQFSIQTFISPLAGWKILAGDFGGDARDDAAFYHAATGEIRVGLNVNGAIPSTATWLTLATPSVWTWTAGNFVSGSRTELAGLEQGVATLHVITSDGSTFSLANWQSSLDPAPAWGIHAGDYDLDGVDDLFAYDPTTGQNYVGRTTGTFFDFSLGPWGDPVGPPAGWQFVPGDFDGDGDTDAVGHASIDNSLWLIERGYSFDGLYAWPLSGAPGDTIDFMASGATETTLEIFRHTSLGPDVVSTPFATVAFVPTNQPIQADPWRVGTGWAPSASWVIPDGSPSGYYSARLTSLDGGIWQAPFVIKPSAAGTSSVALLANVNTWLAYNRWDGTSPGTHGRYTGEPEVSHLRPNPWADPTAWQFETSHLTRAELWIHSWLESEGYAPHVFTDIDFHNGEVGAEYEHLVIGTHPEYYTVEMYRLIEDHLARGGSLLYLGGNGIFALTSFVPGTDQTRMYFLDGMRNGPRAPSLFRNQGWDDQPPLATMAERSLLGVATEACVVLGTPYEVLEPLHPMFEGTGVVAHTLFGTSGWNTAGGPFDGSAGGYRNGLASAFEVDTTDGPGALACPTLCGCGPAEDFPTPPSSLPAGIRIIARATGVEPGTGNLTQRADIAYYDHPSGGHVLSFGSITVGGSLLVDPVLQQMVRNALVPSWVAVPILGTWSRMVLTLSLLLAGLTVALVGAAGRVKEGE